ncbi:MAG: hypothetical protein WBD46_07425 [Acidobacteriaceae bacterium]
MFSDWGRVSPQSLDSVGVPLVRGRGFTEANEISGLPVVLVNQASVKRFFAHQDPLGQRFGFNQEEYAGAFQIVGVFANFILSDPRREIQPLFLRPLGQVYTGYKSADLQAAEASSIYRNEMGFQAIVSKPHIGQRDRRRKAKMNTLAQAEVRRNRLKSNITRLSPAPDQAICNCCHKRKLAGYPPCYRLSKRQGLDATSERPPDIVDVVTQLLSTSLGEGDSSAGPLSPGFSVTLSEPHCKGAHFFPPP